MGMRHVPRPRLEAPVGWLVGMVIGVVAFAGLGTLFTALVLMVDLPSWMRIALGIALIPAAGSLTWIVAASLQSTKESGAPEQS